MNKIPGGTITQSLVAVLVVLYASRIAPPLPMLADSLLHTLVGKILVISLVAFLINGKPGLSLALGVGVVVGMNILSGRGLLEGFRIDQDTDIHPDCLGITLEDLLKVFDMDMGKLMQAVRNSAAPMNIPITSEFAPLLSMYLINAGYKINNTCNLTSKVTFW